VVKTPHLIALNINLNYTFSFSCNKHVMLILQFALEDILIKYTTILKSMLKCTSSQG